MHDSPHAQPITQQSPSSVIPPGHMAVGGPSRLQSSAVHPAINTITNVVAFSIVGLPNDLDHQLHQLGPCLAPHLTSGGGIQRLP